MQADKSGEETTRLCKEGGAFFFKVVTFGPWETNMPRKFHPEGPLANFYSLSA